jgi:molecular chaperone GrpE
MSTVPDPPQAAEPSDVAAEETSPVTDEAAPAAADASETSTEPDESTEVESTADVAEADEPEVEVSEDDEPEVVEAEALDDSPPEPPATTGSVLILDPDDASDDEIVILDADSSSDSDGSEDEIVVLDADSSADSDDSDDVLILIEDEGPSEAEVERLALEARVGGLEADLVVAQAEAKSNKTRLLRTAADYENFRRRTAKEKDDLERFASMRVIREFLPVIDNLERALKHGPEDEEAPVTSLREGVDMVMKQFKQALAKQGVVGFDSEGEMFDPQIHEAIQQVDTNDHPTGTIVNEFQRGYHIHDKLLRPALVVVSRNTSEEQA